MTTSKSITSKVVDVFIYFILAVTAFLCLLPIINTIAISFSSKAAANSGAVGLLPVEPTLVAYQAILKDRQFLRSFFNSIVRVVLGCSINMLMMILTAYPLSRSKQAFKKRNTYMWFFVFTMLFSGGMIPNYLLINKLGLLDTIWALVLPGALPIFDMIILMNFFKGVPDELDEAARIDGASPWVILWKVYLPLAKPALATIALFSIVNHWNSFFDGMIYINNSTKIPLATYIQQLVVEITDMSKMSIEEMERLEQISSANFNSAKVFVTMVPLLVVYPFLQKFFVKGLVMGSVKG